MPRLPRTIQEGVPYHATQRGTDRRDVFLTTTDREVYLSLIEDQRKPAGIDVLAYCLMSNHVHWIVVPQRPDSLAILFRRVHGRYAQYLNARLQRQGHLWQSRYFSCAVGPGRLWGTLRYVEMNPVRATMVRNAAEYPWSSARDHLAGPGVRSRVTLAWDIWQEAGGCSGWRSLLGEDEKLAEVADLRCCTHSGKPFGDAGFVAEMESRFGRHWRSPGRPRKPAASETGTERSGSVFAVGNGGRSG